MKDWIVPALGAMMFWGLWGFLPKITTTYLNPRSAIVYEVLGAIVLAIAMLISLNFQPQVHPIGIGLAMTTGMLGFGGAFCFLTAVMTGPVTLVSTISALYPTVSIFLAIAFLHETITLQQGIGIVLAIVAMILVAA